VSPRVATKTTAPATAPTWRNRITGSGEEAPEQLLANPVNWRIHAKAQQDALAGALDQVGWVQQILVNRRTGFVVDGHARVALALRRGEPTVPVRHERFGPGGPTTPLRGASTLLARPSPPRDNRRRTGGAAERREVT
jgi:hypothetical protein